MPLFGKKKDAPDGPPSYDELQSASTNLDQAPQYLGQYGQNEYPDEKGSSNNFNGANEYQNNQGGYNSQPQNPPPNYGPSHGPNGQNNFNGNQQGFQPNGQYSGPPPGTYTVPANTYAVPLQKTNIAYDTEGNVTRPGYKEYLQRDQQRVNMGDVPKPREAFGKNKGAPLAPSRKGGSSGGFPGAGGRGGPTYYNASENK
ncbi:hypothetical protein PUMCH_001154 [Australozyma saopauloensis]|uniref:Uncharacterized protein n=1 Tax=Australozyma saopauloensis TaxID=291208 RepID=A0AAX4H6M1_9ASCO|nr:hypothetical protein PUMCH_001154 [[Candida] saopauloensis]